MSTAPPDGWIAVNDHRYDLNSRVLVTAIISLVFVIVIVLLLHLYIRYILRRHLSGRSAPVSFVVIGVTAAPEEPPRAAGLNQSAIAALPTFAYPRTGKETVGSAECAVCLSAVEEGETVRLLPICGHVFHVDCIDMWLHSQSTCPVCRATVEPPVVEEGEGSAPPPPHEGCAPGAALGCASGSKEGGSMSRLSSSFRRMLSRGRSAGSRAEDVEAAVNH